MSRPLRKDLHFAQIPEWVLFDLDLSAQAMRLYALLSRMADKDSQSWPSRAFLAEKVGVSVKSVDRYLKELVAASAVTIESRVDDAGDRASNLYTVHVTPPEGVASRLSPPPDSPDATGGDTGDATGGDTSDAVTRASLKKNPLPPTAANAAEDHTDTQSATEPTDQTPPASTPTGPVRFDAATTALRAVDELAHELGALEAGTPLEEHPDHRIRALTVKAAAVLRADHAAAATAPGTCNLHPTSPGTRCTECRTTRVARARHEKNLGDLDRIANALYATVQGVRHDMRRGHGPDHAEHVTATRQAVAQARIAATTATTPSASPATSEAS